jgi:hypothetical protein
MAYGIAADLRSTARLANVATGYKPLGQEPKMVRCGRDLTACQYAHAQPPMAAGSSSSRRRLVLMPSYDADVAREADRKVPPG